MLRQTTKTRLTQWQVESPNHINKTSMIGRPNATAKDLASSPIPKRTAKEAHAPAKSSEWEKSYLHWIKSCQYLMTALMSQLMT
jgi:hypothetical protein